MQRPVTDHPVRGRLVAVEGIDGCGKSTQVDLLARAAGAETTREPGGTALGQVLRAALLDPGLPPMSVRAEALVVLADRAEHVDRVIAPALATGRWVVTDRFTPSTLAYQGHGRGLSVDELVAIDRWATGGLQADLVVLVDVPVAVARSRRAGRGTTQGAGRPGPGAGAGAAGPGVRGGAGSTAVAGPAAESSVGADAGAPGGRDRLEAMDDEWMARVRAGFLAQAAAAPDRWVVVDGRPHASAVAAAIRRAVDERLGAPPGGWR
jgi:dTMP kinase